MEDKIDKLLEGFYEIKQEIRDMKDNQDNIKQDVNDLKQEVSEVKKDVDNMKEVLARMEDNMNEEFKKLNRNVSLSKKMAAQNMYDIEDLKEKDKEKNNDSINF